MALIKLHGSTAIAKIDGVVTDKISKVMGQTWAYYHSVVQWSSSDKNAGITLSGDNLIGTGSTGTTWQTMRANIGKQSGKWYWEISPKYIGTNGIFIGVSDTVLALSSFCGKSTGSFSWWNVNTEYYANSATADSGRDFSTSDVIMVALDMDNKKLWFGANSTWNGAGNPAAGTNPAFQAFSTTVPAYPCITLRTEAQIIANFGDSTFTYAPPAGFSRL